MNNEEFLNIYLENTSFVSDELQKALLKRAKEDDQKRLEAERLKEVLRQGRTNE